MPPRDAVTRRTPPRDAGAAPIAACALDLGCTARSADDAHEVEVSMADGEQTAQTARNTQADGVQDAAGNQGEASEAQTPQFEPLTVTYSHIRRQVRHNECPLPPLLP